MVMENSNMSIKHYTLANGSYKRKKDKSRRKLNTVKGKLYFLVQSIMELRLERGHMKENGLRIRCMAKEPINLPVEMFIQELGTWVT